VSLTDRGRVLIEPMVAESDRIYALLAEQMGAARMRELRRSLDLLIQLGGQDPWPRPWRSKR
jgi:hypothetical protein